MANNTIRSLVVDTGATFGKMQFLGFDVQDHFIKGENTNKVKAVRIRALSLTNAGENLILIPLVRKNENDTWDYASASHVEELVEKVKTFNVMDEIKFSEVSAYPRANKVDNQNVAFVRAELDWTIEAKDVQLATKVQATDNATLTRSADINKKQ